MADNVYTRNGYKNREDYLRSLADDYGVQPMVVYELSGMLGAEEDFDGLVTSLEDYPIDDFLTDCEE